MGFLDKMSGAMKAVTGGAAKVSIEYPHSPVHLGDALKVKVTVVSTGGEVKSNGVYVDLMAREEGSVNKRVSCIKCGHWENEYISLDKKTLEHAIPIAPAFVLGDNDSKTFEMDVQVPFNAQPTYHGSFKHEWYIRGRLETFGNDPDSGYQRIEVK
jgi:hypothetical protein